MTQQVLLMCVGLLHFKLMFVFIVPLISQAVSLGSQCGGFANEYLPADNRALKNLTYAKKTVPYYVMCGRDCNMDKNCKSFNFFQCNKLCELNNSTRAEYPESFVEDQESVYFDEYKDTPLFSLPDISFAHNRSCKALMEAGYYTSGVYKIYPDGFSNGLQVYCDMDIDGGGWIVFQRREDGSVDFDRYWSQYQSGFGCLRGEHWLGNDNLVSLTSDKSHGTWDLRIDLTDWSDDRAFAKYTDFQITGENYTLNYGEYDVSSTAGDSLGYHKGRPFTTKDNDNDANWGNCAQSYVGAWWFNDCKESHLNGYYYPDGQYQSRKGITWYYWHNSWNPLKASTMKIRETDM